MYFLPTHIYSFTGLLDFVSLFFFPQISLFGMGSKNVGYMENFQCDQIRDKLQALLAFGQDGFPPTRCFGQQFHLGEC